jgi:ABC-2 type transport system ATP-binding protein
MPIHCAVDHVDKRLRQNQALKDVSLNFEKGLLHGVIGPDGAGKTTLFRTLAGLLRPDKGTFQFYEDGRPLAFPDARVRMAYMPQQQSLYADLSIGEHLDFFRDLHRIPVDVYKERRANLLHMTRLEKFIDRPAGKLSGGMYKKLGLMCSLLQSPDILLLDEPTNGVDPISRREFWDMLYEFREKKILILFATAYMDEAERCDRVHVLNEGQCIAAGEPRSLIRGSGAETFQDYFLKKIGVTA